MTGLELAGGLEYLDIFGYTNLMLLVYVIPNHLSTVVFWYEISKKYSASNLNYSPIGSSIFHLKL
jgi:hypothetical protein